MASERATIQAVLLGLQFATVHVGGVRSEPSASWLPSGTRLAQDIACTGGFAEKDTTSGIGMIHRVVSLYYDPQCSAVRAVLTVDDSLGVDSRSLNGSAVAYDRNGNATGYRAVSVNSVIFLSTLQTTDALAVGGTPFGRTSEQCSSGACTAAATVNGAAVETGATLAFTAPDPGSPSPGPITMQEVTYAGAPGSLSIAMPQFNSPPTIAGGQPVGGVSATYALAVTNGSPSAVYIDATGTDGSKFSASMANGVITITASGAYSATITIDANGFGSVAYPDGSAEKVVDYRDVG